MGNLDFLQFDATQVAPAQAFELLPAGDYIALIEESEIKQTQAQTGMYLQLVWQVLEGEHKGRKLWHRINVQNPNPTAVEIGQRELSAICNATGVMNPKDSAEFHDRPCLIKVVVKPPRADYAASNEVKAVSPLNGSAPARAAAPAAAAWTPPAASAPAAAKAPWVK